MKLDKSVLKHDKEMTMKNKQNNELEISFLHKIYDIIAKGVVGGYISNITE